MTTKQHDPWALLREVREHFGSCGGVPDYLWDETDDALAAHDDALSAEGKVEWKRSGNRHWTHVGPVDIEVQFGAERWHWEISQYGDAATEEEAKSVAVDAAKRLG